MALHGSHIPRIVARRQPSPPPSPIDHQVALSLSPFLLKYVSILAKKSRIRNHFSAQDSAVRVLRCRSAFTTVVPTARPTSSGGSKTSAAELLISGRAAITLYASNSIRRDVRPTLVMRP